MHGWDEVLLFLRYRLETQAQIWEMFRTRWHKNLVAEPQIPSPCIYFSMFYLQDLPSYQRSMKPKAVQRGRICSHRHTRIFKQKLQILCGWAVSGMGPCLSLQPPRTGALLGSMLQSWYTACSSTAKILLPAHSVATDSLYITVAVSPHSPHFYVLLVKNTVRIVLYLPICWSDEISPHLASQHTCTRTYWDQLEGLGRRGGKV